MEGGNIFSFWGVGEGMNRVLIRHKDMHFSFSFSYQASYFIQVIDMIGDHCMNEQQTYFKLPTLSRENTSKPETR